MRHIAAYKFIPIASGELPKIKADLLAKAKGLDLTGTILLSEEGINLYVAGSETNLQAFQAYLQQHTRFQDLDYKTSDCIHEPYTRMLVKIKKEIISFDGQRIKPHEKTAPHLAPETFKEWYDKQKPMVVLDTRNQYEIKYGSFDDAIDLHIDSFRDFSEAIAQLPKPEHDEPIVTFCTGGIRCEKAAALLMEKGYRNVYQLDGGILNYFAKCGAAHYDGECFVFDKRIAVDGDLQETDSEQCRLCRNPMAGSDVIANEKPICGDCR